MNEKSVTHVLVDEKERTICLDDVEENESYRIMTLKTIDPGYHYMYMAWTGTNIYLYNTYLNLQALHARLR